MARDDCKVLIVGGGPAGISTALFLAWARPELGDRIVVIEKAHYPRDKFCAGGLGGRADRLLSSIKVRIDTPSVPIHGVSLRLADGGICARGGSIGRVVRRLEFDRALVEVARKRGIRVIEGAAAERLTRVPDGVEVETPRGTLRAAVVVGADGVGSFVRRALGLARGGLTAQVVELDTEPVAGDPSRDLLHFDASDTRLSGYAWDFPTLVDGVPLVCRGVYHLRVGDTAHDIRAILATRLARLGLDINRYRIKRFAERGFSLHQPFAAPRVLLVGEAAGIDPLTGEGIPQALQYGAFAGNYLAEKLSTNDFRFDDFSRRLNRTVFGLDLAVRTWLARHYFGPHRAPIERFVLKTPAFVSACLEFFAGRRISPFDALQAARSGIVHWYHHRMGHDGAVRPGPRSHNPLWS